MSRVLGIDLGYRRIGIAMSDPQRLIAQALTTLHRKGSLAPILMEIISLIHEYEIQHVVIGWPLRLNGKEGIQTRRVDRFIEALKQRVSIEVDRWDERMSTIAAERALIEANMSRQGRKAVIDQVAATLILQGWLDRQRAENPNQSWEEDPESGEEGLTEEEEFNQSIDALFDLGLPTQHDQNQREKEVQEQEALKEKRREKKAQQEDSESSFRTKA